jgi:AraC-like DNA-binding protein
MSKRINSQEILANVKNVVLSDLASENLSPASVAKVAGISVRYLHLVFAREGIGFSEWVWERRLQASYEMLTSPAFLNLRIGEIAIACGFNSFVHFSRRFKQRYGMCARQMRKQLVRPHDSASQTATTK